VNADLSFDGAVAMKQSMLMILFLILLLTGMSAELTA